MKRTRTMVVSACLIAAGALTVFSCQGKGKGGGASYAQKPDDPNLNLTGLPIVKEQETFSLLVDDSGKAEDKILLQAFEAETNVHVDLQMMPYSAAVERKNILISSDDYPDAIGGWILGNDDIMNLGMKDGVFIPLEDLIDNYAPNIKEALDLPNAGIRAAMTLPDGHIYTLPYPIGEPLVTFNPWINTNWLKQVGLSMPTTTDEFKKVLIAFRDKIPPVNGQKIIPFSADPVNGNLGVLAGWWGVNAGNKNRNAGGMAMIDGKLQITITRDEFKEMIKYLADLYKEGLIDPEIFTQDQTTWKAKGKMGLYGSTIGYGPGDWCNEPANPDVTVERFGWAGLPVLKAPGVTKPVFRRNGFGTSLFRTQLAITDKAKNPITIIRFWDYIYSPLHSAEANSGKLGIGIEEFEGKFYDLDKELLPQDVKEAWSWGRAWPASLPKFIRDGKTQPPRTRAPDYNYNDVVDKLYEPYLETEIVPDMWLSGADASKAADITTALANYQNQKIAEWVSGQANVDAEWDAYKAQLDKLGIQDLLKIKQDALKK